MADADAQTPEIFPEMRDRVAQTIVAAVAAPLLQTPAPHRQIKFVVRHQDLFRRDLEEIAQLPDRQAAAIHVGGRLQEYEIRAADADPRGLAGEFPVVAKLSAV